MMFSPRDPAFVAHVQALRVAQGLPPVITDPATLAFVAELIVRGDRAAEALTPPLTRKHRRT